jgi:hypothetical protein
MKAIGLVHPTPARGGSVLGTTASGSLKGIGKATAAGSNMIITGIATATGGIAIVTTTNLY